MSMTIGQIISENTIYKGNREVNKIYKGTELIYPSPTPDKFDYFHVYATGGIEATDPSISVGMIHYELGMNMEAPSLEISTDGINWEQWTAGSPRSLYINYDESTGEPIYSYIFLRGYNPDGFNKKVPDQGSYGYHKIVIQGDAGAEIHVGGNIMSLLYGDYDFREYDTIPSIDCFYTLFENCDIYDASELKLPAMTLKNTCYAGMFAGCEKLTYAPRILPADNLVGACYWAMFVNCTSLEKAPMLPAQNLTPGCYDSMFMNCTSLTEAPVLQCKNISYGSYTGDAGCYHNMFSGCTALENIRLWAEQIDNDDNISFKDWLKDVNTQGTLIKKKSLDYDFTSLIPSGWTVEEID